MSYDYKEVVLNFQGVFCGDEYKELYDVIWFDAKPSNDDLIEALFVDINQMCDYGLLNGAISYALVAWEGKYNSIEWYEFTFILDDHADDYIIESLIEKNIYEREFAEKNREAILKSMQEKMVIGVLKNILMLAR